MMQQVNHLLFQCCHTNSNCMKQLLLFAASCIEGIHFPALGSYLRAPCGALAWPQPLAGAQNPAENPAAAGVVATQYSQRHPTHPGCPVAGRLRGFLQFIPSSITLFLMCMVKVYTTYQVDEWE